MSKNDKKVKKTYEKVMKGETHNRIRKEKKDTVDEKLAVDICDVVIKAFNISSVLSPLTL